MAVVRVCAAVLPVFITVVEQRCTRRGQQPTVGLERCGKRRHPLVDRKTVLNPLIVRIACTRIGSAGQAGHIVTADIRHHQRPLYWS